MKGFAIVCFYLLVFSMAHAQYGNPNYSLQNRKKAPPPPCIEEKHLLQGEMIQLNFDLGRSTVGEDQIEPIKTKLTTFLSSPDAQYVTDIEVVSSSSKTPFYKTENGKKVLDPDSNQKNLALAKERAAFAEKVLAPLKSSHPKINFTIKGELAGPEFQPMDLNDRFVTRMTLSYGERLESLYQKNKTAFNDVAFVKSSFDLMDETKYVNLYQAKYKPFHGIRFVIRGYKKELLKCLDPNDSKKPTPGSSKQ